MQNTALNILKTGNNVFITGSAGTGKTYLLNQFIFYLKSRNIIPTIVAPTGIAASHLQGQTIHSYFSLGIRDFIDEYYIESMLEKKYLQTRFSKLKILIIDEISMVSPEIFSSIDKILRAFKQNDTPFGGIQVILSGDFFQLPPISKVPKDKRFAWQSPSWKELALKTCYLQEKYRQDDNVLINILDEIRSGNVSTNTYDVLNSRFYKELSIDFEPTKLYTHNVDVDRINSDELAKINNRSHIFKYKSEGSTNNIEKIFKSSLVLEELTLKKDAVVMFIKNNHEKGYVNGTTGVVIDFDKESNLPIIKTTDGGVVKIDLEDWTMENESANIVAKVSQVPLKLAWAITIHKSQGMTLDAAEIDLSKTFEVGQGYVALSRIKNIDGLRLMGLNDSALSVDPLILHIDDRIKAASKKASDEISAVSSENLQNLFLAYIQSIDGITDEVQIQKQEEILKSAKKLVTRSLVATHLQTKEMIERSNTIIELAENRGMSKGTIIKHLALLKELDPEIDLKKFMPDEKTVLLVKDAVIKLKEQNNKEDFSEDGQLRLKPIFEALDGQVAYDDIKIALW
ncbi:AAA family ATPase (plasmid) [Sulfurimonas aquatica]|uniref:AAA family ATPase n=1 Tax=Sulfurimonas aquatica TaxID=2672570 RepID=A0A975B2P7_9BACT|nr:helix-turn-helix domain-containing protein [Sulfurimonas aquatica]QSZ43141.1 AAA family ATPase [Sulfurimonas aquatica]